MFAGSDGADDQPADKGSEEQNARSDVTKTPEPVPQNETQSQSENDASVTRRVTDEEAKLLKEVMKKKDQIEALKKEIDQFKVVNESVSALGGLDAVRKLVADKKAAEEKAKAEEKKKLEERGEWEKLKASMAEEHHKALDVLQKQIDELKNGLSAREHEINELTIGTAFNNSRFIADSTVLTPSKMRALYGSFFEYENGEVVGYNKPRGAQGRSAFVDQFGNHIGFEESIRKIVDADPDKDTIIRARGKQGSNSNNQYSGTEEKKTMPNGGVNRILAGLKAGQLKF